MCHEGHEVNFRSHEYLVKEFETWETTIKVVRTQSNI